MDYDSWKEAFLASGSIHTKDEHSHTHTPISFHRHNGTVGHTVGMGNEIHSPANIPTEAILSCWEDVSDDVRAEIIAAGYVLPYPTQAEQNAANKTMRARVDASLQAKEDERQLRMWADDNLPQDVVIDPTPEQMRVWDDEGHNIIHLRTDGYGVLIDDSPDHHLLDMGAEILHEGLAVRSRNAVYVGTWSGEIEEMRYAIDGQTRYLYIICTSNVDTYCIEMWSSAVRLSADAAADAILHCREQR